MIISQLTASDCVIEPDKLNVHNFMSLLRDLNYDYSGKHLNFLYHKMST